MLQLTEVPRWYLCNPYVVKGYRAPTSFWNSFRSVLQWHNETLNIHTHMWPCVILFKILADLPYCTPFQEASLEARFTMIFGISSALYCLMASTFFHIVLNVSEDWLNLSHKLDIIGIVVVNLGQQILNTLIWANGNPIAFWLIGVNQTIFAALCIKDIMKCSRAESLWAMRYPAITTVTTIVVTVFTDHHHEAVYASAACSTLVIIAGLVFLKGRIPERCCSNLGYYNSHIWHHICIVIAMAFSINATQHVKGL